MGDFGNQNNFGALGGSCGYPWDSGYFDCMKRKAEGSIKETVYEIAPAPIIKYVEDVEHLIETKGQELARKTTGQLEAELKEAAMKRAGEYMASKETQDTAIKAGVEKASQELIAFKDAYRIGGLKGIRLQYPILFWGGVSVSSLVGLAIAFRVGKLVVGKK